MSSKSCQTPQPASAESNQHRRKRFGRPIQTASLSVAAIALAGLFMLWWPPQKNSRPDTQQPIEALRNELVIDGGTLRRRGETNAFSGVMIEYHRNGALRSRSEIVEGLLHGLSEGWFTNGQRQVSEHFRRGVSHGTRTKWFANGQKLSEGTIVEGRFEGSFRQWHENGALATQLEFVADQPEGLSLAWFPSGALKARVRMKAGKIIEQQFWKDGATDEKFLATTELP